jgi:glyoxalase family protein
MTLQPAGTHHVSALSRRIQRSHDFFTRVLGMRLVIRTVNQDEPTMYHLFFGDGVGSPGSDFTVFDMPYVVPERRGNNSISLSTFRVADAASLEWWRERFDALGVVHAGIANRDDRAVLDFEDEEGTQLGLVVDDGVGIAQPWADSTVPAEHQIRGLGYNIITVPRLESTHRFLDEGLGLQQLRSYDTAGAGGHATFVYGMADGHVHEQLQVLVRDDLPRARYGAGAVHHLALRVPRMADIGAWSEHLHRLGYRNSGVVDRHYFRSVYVREPNDVLIELATDGPGFTVDEPLDGSRLSLPPLLEPRRAEIEAQLKPLHVAKG